MKAWSLRIAGRGAEVVRRAVRDFLGAASGGLAVGVLLLAGLFLGWAQAETVFWFGAQNTAWTNSLNWTNTANANSPPGPTTNVVINGGAANQPLLNLVNGVMTIGSLTLGTNESGGAAILTLANGNVSTKYLQVTGDATLGSTGTVTHSAETSSSTAIDSENHRLFLNVGGNLTINAGGKIDVTGKGYAGAANQSYGPGGGAADTYGGGYGGQGATVNGGTTYGSVTNPVNSGSSGKKYSVQGYPGGGTALISVGGLLTLSGSILADGFSAATAAGAGSGGSVNIKAGSLAGNGTISANGAIGYSNGRASGGGRIAVVLTNANDTAFSSLAAITVYGGGAGSSADEPGAAGTVYLKGTNQPYGKLIVNNNGLTTTRTTLYQVNTNQFDTIVTTNSARLGLGNGAQLTMNGTAWQSDASSKIIVGFNTNAQILASSLTIPTNATLSWTGTNGFTLNSDVVVAGGGRMTHEIITSTGSNLEDHKLIAIINGSLNVMTGGQITVSGKGYGQEKGPGGFVNDSKGGGSHGGLGGATNGTTYGSITNPVRAGTGGEQYNQNGGNAGGVAMLTVNGGLTVNGTIAADGDVVVANTLDGYGAGGSINIVAASLAGRGTVSANGGYVTHASSRGSGGGGGRIAIALTNADDAAFTDLAAIRAYGGPPSPAGTHYSGAAGTVYLKGTNTAYGRLIVDNNLSAVVRTLISDNVTDTTVGDVVLRNSGSLGLVNQVLTVFGNWSNAASFSADAGGVVKFDGTGSLGTNRLFGSSTFAGLICTNAGETLLFQPGRTNTITESLTLAGTSGVGTAVSLLPMTNGLQWYIKVTNNITPVLSCLVVNHSTVITNSNGQRMRAIDSGLADVGVDNTLGGNTNWLFPAPEHRVWNGSVGTSWGTDENWTPGVVPQVNDYSITIPAGGNQPVLNANGLFRCPVTVASGASLSLNGWNLTLNGVLTNAGTITATGSETLTLNSNVVFTGTGAFTPAQGAVCLNGSGVQNLKLNGQTFRNFNISNVNAITIQDSFAAWNLTFPPTGANVTFQDSFATTNLTLSVSGAATLNFAAGKTYTVRNALYLRGASSANRAVLTSSGTWYLNALGYHTARQLAVANSDATGSGKILYAVDSADGGGTTYWDFGAANQLWVGANTSWTTAGNWSPAGVPGASSRVFIDGSTNTIPTVSAGTTVAGLTLVGASTLTVNMPAGNWLTVSGDMSIGPGATVMHTGPAVAPTVRVALNIGGNLTIDGGSIAVAGLGYDLTKGPGYGAGNYNAGSHGGMGGLFPGTSTGYSYGSATNPSTWGSGGMYCYGGGVVLLNVGGTVTVNGPIQADGNNDFVGGGAGAGGSINIVAGGLAGTNRISAIGGTAYSGDRGGGGGGRIAIALTNASDASFVSFLRNTNIVACGGLKNGAGNNGGAGTIYLKGANQSHGRLILDNLGRAPGPWPLGYTYYGSSVSDMWVGDVVLRNNAYMSVDNQTLTVYGSWSNAVATNAMSGGTVVLTGTNSSYVWGGNTWNNLVITNGSKMMYFQNNCTQTVHGIPAFSNGVSLLSTTNGAYWYIQKPGTGTQEVGIVCVKDSNATNNMTFLTTMGSRNYRHNVNWIVLTVTGTVFVVH